MGDYLSVIVPAFNEERRIEPTLERINTYLKERSREFEIIIVDDGSSDNTASVVNGITGQFSNVRLLSYPDNKGKGYAVKTGMLSSRGDHVLICDADLSTPIEEVEKLTPFIHNGYDIVIGSRGLRESDIIERQPWYRETMGKTFNLFVRLLVTGGLHDTQCGFKLFRGDVARTLFSKSGINGFSFDVEILFLARKAGYVIKEVPVRWINSPSSKVKLVSDPIKMFWDLVKIRLNWFFGVYNKID